MRKMRFSDEQSGPFRGVQKTTYLYRVRETGELVEVEMCAGEKLSRELPGGFLVLPDGTEAAKAFGEDLARSGLQTRNRARVGRHAKWPMVSMNAGVNPEQIPELREHWQQHGVVGCDVLPNGDVVWESRAARRKDCESRGLYDRDGGYSDPQPNNL
jgi:hypothetical protein